jgi:hypothetical protein
MQNGAYNPQREQLIMSFGHAEIIRNLSGGYELRGGNEQNRKDAIAWIERFLPEAQQSIFKVMTEKPELKS